MPIPPNGISILKNAIRLHAKAHRADLSADERARASQIVCEITADWLLGRAETRIAVYLATPLELSLDALVARLTHQNKTVCAPRVDAATATMRFHHLPDLSAVTRGAFGVREPTSPEIIRPEIVLAPGLAFDPLGGRLGMGSGYYDRALANISVKVGVCFSGQILDSVPMEAHDITMNWLASEAELVKCERICGSGTF